jgi:hypothetical protein
MSQYARSIKKEIKESVLEALSEESLKIRSDIKTLSDKQ